MNKIKMQVILAAAASAAVLCTLAACGSKKTKPQPPKDEIKSAPQAWTPPSIVTAHGPDMLHNVSRSLLWSSRKGTGRPPAMLANDGDILILSFGELGLSLPYRDSDGTQLSAAHEKGRLLLDGKAVSVSLSPESAADEWDWLQQASENELAGLRMLQIEGKMDPDKIKNLRHVARANPDVGLIIDREAALLEVLSFFNPAILVATSPEIAQADTALLSKAQNIEVLWVNAGHLENLDFLSDLPELHTLLIDKWKVEITGPIPAGMKNLRSFTVMESTMTDLLPLANLAHIEELYLLDCDDLSNVGALGQHAKLKILRIGSCQAPCDLSGLGNVQGLKWLALPTGIEQAQFASAVCGQPGLQYVDLVASDNITDLSFLTCLPDLRGLVALGRAEDFRVLEEIKTLSYLVLPVEAFDETPDNIRRLEQALPQCRVVQGGICLGSGWILLLLPVIALACLNAFFRRRRRAGNA